MANSDSTFIFKDYSADFSRGRVDFYYEMTAGNRQFAFTETLTFPKPTRQFASVPKDEITNALTTLFLLLGISYWKTYCPRTIVLKPFTLSKTEAAFWNTLYTKGLGEFFYRNHIDFRKLVKFPYGSTAVPRPKGSKAKERSLLLFGGGKDSLVAAEILKEQKKDFELFVVGESAVQKNTARLGGKRPIVFKRTLDPKLFHLNKSKGIYNGHIPASAIYSTCGVFAALLYDFSEVITSNEKSANVGNVSYRGMTVNHQWSKSAEFERLFTRYLRHAIPTVHFYSLLRSFTELEIIEKFVQYPRYFNHFASCNRNFRIRGKSKLKWCKTCPKCAFVFAGLAAFLPKEKVIKIFGNNLFADPALIPLYQELLGFEKFKPFECVGTPEETRKAFKRAYPNFKEDPVMIMFKKHNARTRTAT